ncbi:MAG: helix-turn-helix domain-containing protein [Nitrososphaerales archaeon]
MAGLAAYLNVSIRFVRRLVAEKRVPVQKIGSRVYFDLDDIDVWLAANKRPADPRWSGGTAS